MTVLSAIAKKILAFKYYFIASIAFLLAMPQVLTAPIESSSNCSKVYLGENEACLEIALTLKERAKGLSYRSELLQNRGMLFVWEQPARYCMWMKNTLIDLDVAFMRQDGTITSIQPMISNTLNIHCSKEKVLYAIEMNKAWFKSNNVAVGQPLDIQSILDNLWPSRSP